jgi:hypothetical protein
LLSTFAVPMDRGAKVAYIKMMTKQQLLGMTSMERLEIDGKRVTRLTESVWSVDGKVHGLRGAVLALAPSEEKGRPVGRLRSKMPGDKVPAIAGETMSRSRE